MSDAIVDAGTRDIARESMQDIVVEEVFPHKPSTLWRVMTSGELMARWLMAPAGFEPVEGCRFTFRTTPAGAWDGTIRCQVLEVQPRERLVYSWQGGHDSNVGYGSKLDTVVTWTLTEVAGGTRLRLVHAGFRLPANETALRNMGDGWRTILPRLRNFIEDEARPAEERPA